MFQEGHIEQKDSKYKFICAMSRKWAKMIVLDGLMRLKDDSLGNLNNIVENKFKFCFLIF